MANHVLYDAVWESDRLADCTRDAALAYPWIFLVADDHGRFEYKARAVWKHAFAYREDVTVEDVARWLDEYWRVGLLTRYHIEGGLAYWYKFRGRKPSERRPSEYPDPDGMPVLTYQGATAPRRGGDEGATEGRRGGANTAPEVDKSRVDQSREQTPAAVASALPAPGPSPDDTGTTPGEVPPAESVALAKARVLAAPLPWSTEAAELWWQEYRGDPPKAFFGALKPLVRRHGWERVRPALVTYMAETPADYVNIAGKFVAAFGTWEARARGVPAARASPAKGSVGEKSVAAVERFLRRGGELDRPAGVLEGADEAGDSLPATAGRRNP